MARRKGLRKGGYPKKTGRVSHAKMKPHSGSSHLHPTLKTRRPPVGPRV